MSLVNSAILAALPQSTCLFTGAVLTPDTREEHTILRSLGGRVRSRRVTSSAFNEACGSHVDPYLLLPYAETMATLRPLLSSEHKGGELSVDIPGDNGTFIINEDGQLVLKGIKIIAKDPVSGRPTSFAGVDTAKVIKMAENLKKPGQNYTVSVVPMTDAPEWFRGRPVVCAEIEVAAIKCTLLTFDEILADTPARRFTRTLALQPVRDFIRDAISTRKIDGEALHRFSLGIQYDRLMALEKLRGALGIASSPLSHFLIASGNSATRTVDAVWWVLGIDPFGFRLSQTWDGPDFTCSLVNRTLRGGGVDGPFWLNTATSLCSPTDFRAFPDPVPSVARGQEVVGSISVFRCDGYRQALDEVERTADEYVIARFTESALLGIEHDHSVVSAVRRRLERLYRGRLERPGVQQLIANMLNKHAERLQPNIRSASVTTEHETTNVDWATWLNAYRGILADLRSELGLPGHVFTNRIEVKLERTDQRKLGDADKVDFTI